MYIIGSFNIHVYSNVQPAHGL